MRTILFGVDVQGSFTNVVPQVDQQIIHDGELCVAGAMDDANRIAALIDRIGQKIHDAVFTMDSHSEWHISHTRWYKSSSGRNPNPFTVMDNVNGEIIGTDGEKYNCAISSLQAWTLHYLNALKLGGKFAHVLWPDHCLIGTPGHNIVPVVRQALLNWSNKYRNNVIFKTKGSNPLVEHFGIVHSEVEDPNDFTTKPDTGLITDLMTYDRILVLGQAKSHCVRESIMQIVRLNPDFAKKCVLITDCMSNVTGFEQQGEDFVKDAVALGAQTCLSTDL
jgi:nicotinamidase/pyrazinamidase